MIGELNITKKLEDGNANPKWTPMNSHMMDGAMRVR
jgi:hypothetical protein